MKRALLLISLTIHLGHTACPDRWALNKVDVWTHRVINGTGQHKKSISLYELDTHEMIEVTKANVSVLCEGMIKNFQKLKYLTLVNANISKIEPAALQSLNSLTHLSLAVNHLATVERTHFKELKQLRVLYLSKNQIENVEEDAFLDLVQLKKIYLDRNRLHEIDSKWFLRNNKITLIDLAFNNLSKVQNGAFNLPGKSIVEIRLQNNNIEEIEENSVVTNALEKEIPQLILRLQYNNISEIKSDFVKNMDRFRSTLVLDWNSIKCFSPSTLRILKEVSLELHADNNPLSCDCLEAATNFVKDHESKAKFYYSSRECLMPGLKVDNWYQKHSGFFSN